jgi:hypothetical protein
MLSVYDKINIVNDRILNLRSCIITLNQEIEIFKKIEPVDQETVDGYLFDISLKQLDILTMQDLLSNLNKELD